eukprot:CAMPEP_0168413320 /NCGR_PEP_ID=MMETSP0228-20121227/29161_1 /TAXON_ID=133427 /ORGANISM="Protoceratium reticulatum, Strain CCCM 535 (=CCMP 1889)" /LENGTH=126 /DNA_ID=CAMNT_0008427105 /DNA_START=56 /DNA_END=432 /DNA_ORIENTATION=+
MDADSVSSVHDFPGGLHDYRFDNQSDKTVVVLLEEADAPQRQPHLQQQFNGGCLSEEIIVHAGRAISKRMRETAILVSAAFLVEARYHVFKQRARVTAGTALVVLAQHYLEAACNVRGPGSLLGAL